MIANPAISAGWFPGSDTGVSGGETGCSGPTHYRVSESLPAELGCFDLVIIDEASQSDLSALPALLRGKKALVVGDDKQVAPEVVGYEEKQIRQLVNTDLVQQVPTYRQAMSPERSLYDLYMVVNAGTSIMLKEHFRCVGPIIEYSKREFYNHELIPLRVPVQSERLDPPLIDILVTDGHRSGTKDVNVPEARVIVEEIKRIIADGKASQHAKKRTIGVVTLLGTAQAKYINELVLREIDPKDISARQIACGDARTFQGEERDIILLSMVAGPDKDARAATGAETKKRFNVAASRARDRMYLVRSVTEADLSVKDELRLGLIRHFTSPYAQDVQRQRDLRQLCESGFEREVYDALVERGYVVTPQVRFGSQFRIDMVVEGEGDRRLAVECDGDSSTDPSTGWLTLLANGFWSVLAGHSGAALRHNGHAIGRTCLKTCCPGLTSWTSVRWEGRRPPPVFTQNTAGCALR